MSPQFLYMTLAVDIVNYIWIIYPTEMRSENSNKKSIRVSRLIRAEYKSMQLIIPYLDMQYYSSYRYYKSFVYSNSSYVIAEPKSINMRGCVL